MNMDYLINNIMPTILLVVSLFFFGLALYKVVRSKMTLEYGYAVLALMFHIVLFYLFYNLFGTNETRVYFTLWSMVVRIHTLGTLLLIIHFESTAGKE